jgi:hypothetical protein
MFCLFLYEMLHVCRSSTELFLDLDISNNCLTIHAGVAFFSFCLSLIDIFRISPSFFLISYVIESRDIYSEGTTDP